MSCPPEHKPSERNILSGALIRMFSWCSDSLRHLSEEKRDELCHTCSVAGGRKKSVESEALAVSCAVEMHWNAWKRSNF